MLVFLKLCQSSLFMALAGYGLISLILLLVPSMTVQGRVWIFVPIEFGLILALKLIFSRDADGRLIPSP